MTLLRRSRVSPTRLRSRSVGSIASLSLSAFLLLATACSGDGKLLGAYNLLALGSSQPKPGFTIVGIELNMPGKFAPYVTEDFKLECSGGSKIDAAGLCGGPVRTCESLGMMVMNMNQKTMKASDKQDPSVVFIIPTAQSTSCTTVAFRSVWRKPFTLTTGGP